MRKNLSAAQRNGSAAAHQIANIFLISLAQMGKIARKRQFTDICGSTLFPRTRIMDALSKRGADMRVCVCSCAGHVRQVVSALNLAGWWINHKTTFPILYEVFLFVMAHLMSSRSA